MLDTEQCWHAVCNRDAAQDGVSGLLRTARDILPAQLPGTTAKRDNVSFMPT